MRFYKIVNISEYNRFEDIYYENKRMQIESTKGECFKTKLGVLKDKLNYNHCPCSVLNILDAYRLYESINSHNVSEDEYILELESIKPDKYKDELYVESIDKNNVVAIYKKVDSSINVIYRKNNRVDVSFVDNIELGLSESRFYEISGWKCIDLNSTLKYNLANANNTLYNYLKSEFVNISKEDEDINIVEFIRNYK